MTDLQKRFFEVVKYYEQLKDKLDETNKELETVMTELGMNSYHQDPETMAVYQVVRPTGTFVSFKDIKYVRTALEGEKQGSLSKKAATEAGFDLVKRS